MTKTKITTTTEKIDTAGNLIERITEVTTIDDDYNYSTPNYIKTVPYCDRISSSIA